MSCQIMDADATSSNLILSAMDALEAEGGPDRYTTSIGFTPHTAMQPLLHSITDRISARPSKRRKLHHLVSAAKFLDIEAVEADRASDEEDTNSDDDLFIDDEPIHAHPPLSRQHSPEPNSDADDDAWAALAAEYERRAALERVSDNAGDDLAPESERRAAVPPNTAVPTRPLTLEEKMADVPLVLRLPSLLSPPMYTIRILPYWEHRLMRHLCSCAGVISSGTWGVGSGVVFAETRRVGDTGETGLLLKHLRKWKSAYRFYNPDLLVPRLCPLSERTRLLQPPGDSRFVHPYDLGNRWVRVTVYGIYHNDLAFVEETDPTDDGQRLRVVPRIALSVDR
ncbi:hypothetical protein C8F01DRAFT_200066 [Mycena amicta]|nr:hypothetical protein C8F01DRAFT_200066 [Mycena amicta]